MSTWRRIIGDEDDAPFGHWPISSDGPRWTSGSSRSILRSTQGARVRSLSECPRGAGGDRPLTWRLDSGEELRAITVSLDVQGNAARYLAVNRASWGVLYPLTYALSIGVVFAVLLWLTCRRSLVIALITFLCALGAGLLGAWVWNSERALAAVLLLAPVIALVQLGCGARALGRRARRKTARLTALAHLGLMLALVSAISDTLLRIRFPPFASLDLGWNVAVDCLQVFLPSATMAFVLARVTPAGPYAPPHGCRRRHDARRDDSGVPPLALLAR